MSASDRVLTVGLFVLFIGVPPMLFTLIGSLLLSYVPTVGEWIGWSLFLLPFWILVFMMIGMTFSRQQKGG